MKNKKLDSALEVRTQHNGCIRTIMRAYAPRVST